MQCAKYTMEGGKKKNHRFLPVKLLLKKKKKSPSVTPPYELR